MSSTRAPGPTRKRARTLAALAAWATLVSLPAAPAGAQQALLPAPGDGSAEQRLVQRLDSLRPVLEAARADWDRAQAVRDSLDRVRGEERLDTLLVGPFTVVARPDQAGEASRVVGVAWEGLSAVAGTVPGLEGRVVFFDHAGGRRPANLQGQVATVTGPAWIPRVRIEANARAALGHLLASTLGPALAAWTGGWNVDAVRDPGDVYRELATAPHALGKRCLAGEASACWTALGLGEGGDALDAWYTPEEQVALVLGLHDTWGRTHWWYRPADDGGLGERCAAEAPAGRREACSAFLAHYRTRVPPPLGFAARQAMVWVALQAGGPDAFRRLADPAHVSPDEALVAAGGMTGEALAEAWRAWVVAHRPEVYGGLGATTGVAAFWFFFLSFLALRSTRWRSA